MFNPQSRWDRPLPRDKVSPGEKVEAGVIFRRGRVLPLWFIFSGERHVIKKMLFAWQERKGCERLFLFRVEDNAGCYYTLCFNREQLTWKMIPYE